MEPIKISIDVNFNVSESAKAFFAGLFGGCSYPCNTPVEPVDPTPSVTQAAKKGDGTQPAPTQPAASAPTPEPAKPAQSAPAAPAPNTPAAGPKHTLDELRKELAAKVNSHREAIKTKLTAYGAKSLTTLAKENYDEMFDFLTSL